MPAQPDLVPFFMPALGALLIRAEDGKGAPLTEAEATMIRDKATVVMMEVQDARRMEESRGYRDIGPENLWHDWQKLRDELGRKPSIPAGPRFNFNKRGDPELQQAAEEARATLGVFRELIRAKKGASTYPMFKTRLTDGENAAFMWLTDATECEAGFRGQLFEVPRNWPTRRVGDVVTVAEGDVVDWMVNDNGHLHGGFSIRVIREREPECERERYDDFIGVKIYAPLPKR
jgi:uncharacterized protein YegJ (DUF2314 family)